MTTWLYASPIWPAGNNGGLSVIAGQAAAEITIEYARMPKQPLVSVARIVKLKVPMEDGDPVMAPVAGLSVRPGGRLPLETE